MSTLRDGRVVLATGDSRPVEKAYGDGAIDCPWCGSGWYPDAGRYCPNPACMASRWADEAYVRDTLARLAAEAGERAARSRAEERSRHAVEARLDADALELARLSALAESRGQCLTCLGRSDWRSRPRLVRHRKPDFHDGGR